MAHRVCPWWMGYLLANPLRRLVQNPEEILEPYIHPGMTVLDIGSAMGFFGLPLAKMVGPDGRVICVDVQEKMIRSLNRRARRAGLQNRMITRVCSAGSLGIEDMTDQIDFALAFAVFHEVPELSALLKEVHDVLRPGGKLLACEPMGHVSSDEFKNTCTLIKESGFVLLERPQIRRSRSLLLEVEKKAVA